MGIDPQVQNSIFLTDDDLIVFSENRNPVVEGRCEGELKLEKREDVRRVCIVERVSSSWLWRRGGEGRKGRGVGDIGKR